MYAALSDSGRDRGSRTVMCVVCVSFEAEGQTDDDGSLCCLAKGV